MFSPMHLLALLSVLFIAGFFSFFLAIPVAWQARGRGYSFVIWFLAVACSLNPFLVLMVLAVMPDARNLRRRSQLRAELEAKLAARPRGLIPFARPLSPGDQSTALPLSARSIGDEETRVP